MTGKPSKLAIFILLVIGIVLISTVVCSFLVNIEPGYEGVLIDKAAGGVQEQALSPGWHLKAPVTQSIVSMDTRIRSVTDTTSCSSKDLQNVTTTVTVKYQPVKGKTPWIYNNIGSDYAAVVIDPDVKDAIKAVTAKYNVEELITKREFVRMDMEDLLSVKLAPYNILVDGVDITNFEPSPEYCQAIEAKQVSQQRVQQSQYELDKAKIDAAKTIATAEAEAKAIQITGDALKNNPTLVQLEAVKKWDGKLPLYSGGGNMIGMLPAPMQV